MLGVGSLVAAAVMLTLVVIGPAVRDGRGRADIVALGDEFVVALGPAAPSGGRRVLIAWAATIFHLAPDHHTPWRCRPPRRAGHHVLWLLFSGGLGLRVFAQQSNAVFGTLGGVLIVLLWFWLLSLAVLIGGEINQVLLEPV